MRTAADMLRDNIHDIVSVTPDATLYDALQVMTSKKLGAMMVKDGDEYVGIWTERDLLRNVLTDNFDLKTARISDYMITTLKCSDSTDTSYDMMDKFLGLRIRHLLIKEDEKVIGMLSIGDVIKACLRDKTAEIKELNALASWEYYEEWKPRSVE